MRRSRIYLSMVLLLASAIILALAFGSVANLPIEWIVELRLPRILVGLAVGAGLGVAGLVVQAVFANPLCDPYSLGISSGGTLGAVIGYSIAGAGALHAASIAAGSFLGCLLLGSIMVSWGRRPSASTSTLLLVGISMGLLASSLVTVWIAVTDPQGITQALHWLLGDLGRYRLLEAVMTCLGVLWIFSRIWRYHESLDMLLLGEAHASALGVDSVRERSRFLMWVYILVGLCVSAAGMIGFVGLIVPHLARRWIGVRHQYALPLAALLGAAFLVTSDLLGRVIVAPLEIPSGVVAALIGAPIFIFTVFKTGARHVA